MSVSLVLRGAYLGGQDDERHADHDHHVELWRPDVRDEVTVAHGGEGYDDVVSGLEEVEVAMASPLKVLDAADAAKIDEGYDGKFAFKSRDWLYNSKTITNLNWNCEFWLWFKRRKLFG